MRNEIFLDTANVEDIRKANDMGVICGVTTKFQEDYRKEFGE